MTGLARFIDTGSTSIHGAINIESTLREGGFSPFRGGAGRTGTDGHAPAAGETWFLRREGTIMAFRAGTRPPSEGGMLIMAAHTDSPGLQLKHRSARYADSLVQVPVEVYGGPILATWLDRDLTIAGRLGLRSGPVEGVLIAPARPMAIIPNLAIHLNREINEKLTYNRQDHLQALFGPFTSGNPTAGDVSAPLRLLHHLAEYAGLDPTEILDAELNLVPTEPATITASGLIMAPRIDNLAGCYALMEALRRAPARAHTQVALFFDHEEIGSTTAYGAAGAVTEHFLRRVATVLGDEPLEEILPRTVLLSNDAAHARHPSYRDKHDEGYAPILGGGPVIKKSAIRRYASELPAATWLARLAERSGIPLQYMQNRSDIAAGSTIGPALASRLSIPSVDLGIPILAMHSIRETGALSDVEQMIALLTDAYGGNLDEILDADPPRQG
ncbi:MAG: M18 family aminopeptidase [Spirochaetaceae bacterium]|nr:MAG: M18 family aminopeptidase [Spirochaetaceae bacterium]